MASCEKCWSDAFNLAMADGTKSQPEFYHELIVKRKYNPCTPKQQAGQFWDEENKCDNRFPKEA